MEEYYIFTIGWGQPHQNHYVKVYGDYEESRKKMEAKYGEKWSMQYTSEQWERWEKTRPPYIPKEELLEVIE